MGKIPQALSVGEETLDLHLRANKLTFEREVRLIPARQWRVDFLLRQFRIAVEVDGGTWKQGRHSRGSGYAEDCAKVNAITLAGYSVLRYTTEMVERGDAIRDILRAVCERDQSACAHL